MNKELHEKRVNFENADLEVTKFLYYIKDQFNLTHYELLNILGNYIERYTREFIVAERDEIYWNHVEKYEEKIK